MTAPTCTTVCTPVTADRPFWRWIDMFGPGDHAFLLDSALDRGGGRRYSYLGGRPAALLTGRCAEADDLAMELELWTWREPDGQEHDPPRRRSFVGDPFTALRELNARYPAGSRPADAPPFVAGLVGYFGYETAGAIERLPEAAGGEGDPPDLAFLLVEDVFVHDHERQTTALHVTRRGPDGARRAAARTARWLEDLAGSPSRPVRRPPTGQDPALRARFSREQYMAAVERCREHIRCGDVFEVCLTQQLTMELAGPAPELYEILREVNPAPYAAYLQFPGCQIVGSSPECFLRLDQDGRAVSRPMKGTRHRGRTPAADAALREELAGAEKDGAENIMIVDLVRNDLGRVCRIGSVEVSALREVETYATVHQLVSTVTGRLKPEYDAFDLVRACFPGGSMTGAPKIEAMKIIRDIEPERRGVYSGALGFIDADGAMELGMVIRTVVCRDGVATFGVGGAVVADSDPAAEYDEAEAKARALVAAVSRLARGGAS